jgi:hypothetical protein
VLAHDAGDLVAAGVDSAPAQLEPGLAHAVDAPVAASRGFDLDQQRQVVYLAANGFRDLRA